MVDQTAGAPGSAFSTVPHAVHRMRRAALNPFFSKRAVTQLEPIIREKAEKLASRFEAAVETREVIRIDVAYMALTMDVITQYAYAGSYNYLAEPDFKLEWKNTLIGGFEMGDHETSTVDGEDVRLARQGNQSGDDDVLQLAEGREETGQVNHRE